MNRLSACGTLSGCRMSAFSTLKTTALAQMAMARVSTAVMANPGDLRNCRKASRKSAFMMSSHERQGYAAPQSVYARGAGAVPSEIVGAFAGRFGPKRRATRGRVGGDADS